MSDILKKDLMIKSGLGEEVLSSYKKEKYIKIVASKLQDMMDEGINTEEMARSVVNLILKEKDYE